MKNTKICPKCDFSNIVKVPGLHGSGTGANAIRTSGMFAESLVSRYVCTDCGYSEEWIDSKEDLEKIRKTYQ